MRSVQELVDAADVAGLLIAVDGLAATRDWDGLVGLARRCMHAVEMGKQLWPVAMHVDYRLAWEAPAAYAGAVLRPGAGRFALGPLTEVAASTHDWASLAPHLGDPASAAAVAQERVLRAEDLRSPARALVPRPELPLVLAPWEPDYALPRYRDRSAAFPEPPGSAAPTAPSAGLATGRRLADDEAVTALEAVVEAWSSQSAGKVRAVAVEGEAAEAVAGLGLDTAALRELTGADALAVLQWSGASGGAYGRRRGGASGRFSAWWAAAALAGLDWPVEPDELGAAVAELRWHRWTTAEAEAGWTLRLAVADPADGLAWAIDATDQRAEED